MNPHTAAVIVAGQNKKTATTKDPINAQPNESGKPLSDTALNRVMEACEAAGLDPTQEIMKVMTEGACETCGHSSKITDKMRAEIWIKLLEFIQPKLRAVEGNLNIKELSLVQILSMEDE